MIQSIKRIFFTVIILTFISISYQGINIQASPVREYVLDELGGYLSGFGYSDNAEVEVSQKYDVINEEGQQNNSWFFVEVDNEPIGAVSVATCDGKNITAFLHGKFTESIDEQDSIALVSNEDGIGIYRNGKTKVLSGKNSGKTIHNKRNFKTKKINYKNETDNVVINEKATKGIINDMLETGSYNTRVVNVGTHKKTLKKVQEFANGGGFYCMNPVTFRKNYTIDGKGVCWAASGASIIDYVLHKTYTTKNVYNALKAYYGTIPIGTVEWKKRMFAYYGLPMSYTEGKLSYSRVVLQLQDRVPIMCDFYKSTNGSDLKDGHSVVLCGCYYRADLQKNYYVYMDPNYAADEVYVVNHVFESELNTSEGYTFYYNDGSSVLNNWVGAFT